MTTHAQLSDLMTQVRQRLKLETTSDRSGEGLWSLSLDPAEPIQARFDPDRATLVLKRLIGRPPEGDQTNLHEICLVINNGWHQTAGLGIALDGPGGNVVQFQDIAASGLTTETLTEALAAFESRAQGLKELVRQRPGTTPEPIPSTALAMLGMRV